MKKKIVLFTVVLSLVLTNMMTVFAENKSYSDSTYAFIYSDSSYPSGILTWHTFITEHNQRYSSATARVTLHNGTSYTHTAPGQAQWAKITAPETAWSSHTHGLY